MRMISISQWESKCKSFLFLSANLNENDFDSYSHLHFAHLDFSCTGQRLRKTPLKKNFLTIFLLTGQHSEGIPYVKNISTSCTSVHQLKDNLQMSRGFARILKPLHVVEPNRSEQKRMNFWEQLGGCLERCCNILCGSTHIARSSKDGEKGKDFSFIQFISVKWEWNSLISI